MYALNLKPLTGHSKTPTKGSTKATNGLAKGRDNWATMLQGLGLGAMTIPATLVWEICAPSKATLYLQNLTRPTESQTLNPMPLIPKP